MSKVYGDITIDVASSPYESGFKFNTLPFGGLTIDAGNAVCLGSATDVKIAPRSGFAVILGTSGTPPTATSDLRGALFVEQGGLGVADKLHVCLKASSGSYNWILVKAG